MNLRFLKYSLVAISLVIVTSFPAFAMEQKEETVREIARTKVRAKARFLEAELISIWGNCNSLASAIKAHAIAVGVDVDEIFSGFKMLEDFGNTARNLSLHAESLAQMEFEDSDGQLTQDNSLKKTDILDQLKNSIFLVRTATDICFALKGDLKHAYCDIYNAAKVKYERKKNKFENRLQDPLRDKKSEMKTPNHQEIHDCLFGRHPVLKYVCNICKSARDAEKSIEYLVDRSWGFFLSRRPTLHVEDL